MSPRVVFEPTGHGGRCSRSAIASLNLRQIAQENLRKPEIQTEITRLQRERAERTEITADKVLSELAAIAFSRITSVSKFSSKGLTIKDSENLPDWDVASVQEVGQIEMGKAIKTYIKQHSKTPALKLLMQHLGLTSDFNQAIAAFRKYGLIVRQKTDGSWEVTEVSVNRRLAALKSLVKFAEDPGLQLLTGNVASEKCDR